MPGDNLKTYDACASVFTGNLLSESVFFFLMAAAFVRAENLSAGAMMIGDRALPLVVTFIAT